MAESSSGQDEANPAAWLAQLGERRSAEREVAGSNPGRGLRDYIYFYLDTPLFTLL